MIKIDYENAERKFVESAQYLLDHYGINHGDLNNILKDQTEQEEG